MSAFAEALGGLAQDYGTAGQIKQRSDLAQNEMQLRTAHENLYNALAQKDLQQSDLAMQQARMKAKMPLFLGQPYTMAGKRYQDTWDIHQGRPGKLELGPDENPTDAFLRQYHDLNGVDAPADVRNAALYHQYGITAPKAEKDTQYELRQNSRGEWVRIPMTPGEPNSPTGVIGKLADMQSSAPTLDPIDTAYGDRLAKGDLTIDQLGKIYKGKVNEAKLKAVTDYAYSKGLNTNAPQTATAQGIIMKTTPVLDQVDRMTQDIDRLKLGGNNTPGYLASSRLKYSLGIASPEGSLGKDIAGLSLGSVVEAASALGGSSRAFQALQLALQHTPNPWVDSPQMIKGKLTEIRARLQDIVDEAKQNGTKSGLPNQQVGGKPQVKIGADGSITVQ